MGAAIIVPALLSRGGSSYRIVGLSAGGGGGFTPGGLTNLVAWYKADTGVTTSGGNVTQVLDQSGNGNTLTNSGTVPFTASSAYNSHNALGFVNANNANLNTGSTGTVTLPAVNALSVFIVARSGTASNFPGAVSIGAGATDDFSSTASIAAITAPSSGVTLETSYNSTVIDTSIVPNTNFRLGLVIGSGTATHYKNNVAGSAASVTLNLTTPSNIVIGNRWLSGAPSTGNSGWDGPILEAVITSAALSSTDRNNLDTYFTNKWGI